MWIAVGGNPESAARAGVLGLPMALAIIGGMPERFAPFAERPGAILYRTSVGSVFAISRGSALSSGTHTQMAFTVDDIEAAAADLRARGVVFEAYETPKTTDGIATIGAGLTGGFAGWFAHGVRQRDDGGE